MANTEKYYMQGRKMLTNVGRTARFHIFIDAIAEAV